MDKDFQKWCKQKAEIHEKQGMRFFHEREIWWCALGLNIGFEQDGKNDRFERPVLVLRIFNSEVLWAVPLTSQDKSGKYYHQFEYEGKKYAVILSQIRLISSRRLLRKMRMLGEADFQEVRRRIKSLA